MRYWQILLSIAIGSLAGILCTIILLRSNNGGGILAGRCALRAISGKGVIHMPTRLHQILYPTHCLLHYLHFHLRFFLMR